MITPRPGTGRSQWNGSSWFGSQVGSSLWLLVGAGVLFAYDWRPGLILLGCFVLANVVGTILWRSRARIAPYPAYQLQFGVLAVTAAVAIVAIDRFGMMEHVAPRLPTAAVYVLLLLYPALMVAFHLIERADPPTPVER